MCVHDYCSFSLQGPFCRQSAVFIGTWPLTTLSTNTIVHCLSEAQLACLNGRLVVHTALRVPAGGTYALHRFLKLVLID